MVAAVVTTVLGCDELFTQWDTEVAAMRDRINGLRKLFVDTMAAKNSWLISHLSNSNEACFLTPV